MDHQRYDDLARVMSVVKGVRKRFEKYPPKILVNFPVNLPLAFYLREIRIETGHEPIAQILTSALIVPLSGARHIFENVRKKNQSVHPRCFRIFSRNCSKVRADEGFFRKAAQRASKRSLSSRDTASESSCGATDSQSSSTN